MDKRKVEKKIIMNEVIKTKYGSEVSVLELLPSFQSNGKRVDMVFIMFEYTGFETEANINDLRPSRALDKRLAELRGNGKEERLI